LMTDDMELVIVAVLPEDAKAARELADRAGISVADLVLLALGYCLRAKGAEPFRDLLATGGLETPWAEEPRPK